MKNSVLKAKETAGPPQGDGVPPTAVPAAGATPSSGQQACAPAPSGGAVAVPNASAAALSAPKAVGAKAPVDAGSPDATETLDERDARRIVELAAQMKMVRRRRDRRQAKGQKVLLKKSTSEMKDYLDKLPPGAKFTMDVLVRLGTKAEELGLSPTDLFVKMGVAEAPKQK